MKNPSALPVEVRTKPLPGDPIYTLYQLFINGRLVREQISAFSDDIYQLIALAQHSSLSKALFNDRPLPVHHRNETISAEAFA